MISIENKKRPRGPKAKLYPLGRMRVGDRIFIDPKKRNSASVCASRYGKKNDMIFSVHWDDDYTGLLVLERLE